MCAKVQFSWRPMCTKAQFCWRTSSAEGPKAGERLKARDPKGKAPLGFEGSQPKFSFKPKLQLLGQPVGSLKGRCSNLNEGQGFGSARWLGNVDLSWWPEHLLATVVSHSGLHSRWLLYFSWSDCCFSLGGTRRKGRLPVVLVLDQQQWQLSAISLLQSSSIHSFLYSQQLPARFVVGFLCATSSRWDKLVQGLGLRRLF